MKPRSIRLLAVAATLALVGALTSCADSGSSSDSTGTSGGTSSSGGTYTIAAFPNGNTLDPWGAPVSNFTSSAVYDSLTRLDKDGKVVPWLATEWTYNTPTQLTVKLRTDVKFSDGTPMDAAAVVANIEHGKSVTPANVGNTAYLPAIEKVTAVDSSTVQFDLNTPNPDLPYAFSQQTGWVVSTASLTDPDSMKLGGIGTGPYVVDAANSTAGTTYTFTKNPTYWADSQAKRFDTVVIKIIGNPTAQANAAATGGVDFLITPDASTTIEGFEAQHGDPVSLDGFAFQDVTGRLVPALADVKVRQAMNYAIDREAILEGVFKGSGAINGSVPFSSASPGYDPSLDSYYTYDPAKAKSLLAEAGYPDGFDLNILTGVQNQTVAEAVAGYLREAGINPTVSVHDTDITAQNSSGTWPLGSILTGITGQPFSDLTALMTKASAFNPAGNEDPKINEYLAQAAQATSDEDREKIFAEAAKYSQQQAWFLTPVLLQTTFQHNPKVAAITVPTGVNVPDLYWMTPA